MRLRSLDSGRLFSAKIAFRTISCATLQIGRFCGTFSAAPARFFTSAQVFAPSRPARASAALDPRQGRRPCTCPASPFMAKPGFCVQRGFAEGAYAVPSTHLRYTPLYSVSIRFAAAVFLSAVRVRASVAPPVSVRVGPCVASTNTDRRSAGCAVCVCLRRARTVPGAFYAAPEPLTRFFEVSGAYRLGFADPAPLLRPRSGSAVPPEGEVPGDFSLGLPLVGVRKER